MREIKFRAWDKNKKEMCIVDRLTFMFETEIGIMAEVIDGDPKNPDWRRMAMPEEFELMQFTGLLAKNGKEIYEGDILKRFAEVNEDYGYDLVKVQWNNDRCYWELERANDHAHYWGYISGSHAREGRYEVVGNIYENPDLLP